MRYKLRLSLYREELCDAAEKVDYSSKAESSNVWGVGTVFAAYLHLGRIFPYNLKTLYCYFPENLM